MNSILILGRQPALGLAELESLYGARALTPVATHVAKLEVPVNQVDFRRLGGSTRLAEIIATVPDNLWKSTEKQLVKSAIAVARNLPEGKIQLGLSALNIPITTGKLNATGLTLKKILRSKTGRSVRLTPNPELELSTAQVMHNKLTGPTGIELLAIATSSNTTIIARTTHVQDIDSYTLRDRGRPKRDARVGMLPPKLAQVLLNLAGGSIHTQTTRTVLDPFCGTGVVLQEALLMGYNAYGTDLELRMVDYSRTNLEWLTINFPLSTVNYTLQQGDATDHQWSPTPDFVTCEAYLGRPFTSTPSPEMLTRTVSEVNLILKKFLINMRSQIPTGMRLCLAVPAWNIRAARDSSGQDKISAHFRHLPLIDQISDLGYNQIRFEHVRSTDLLYYREGQIVARELLVLQKG